MVTPTLDKHQLHQLEIIERVASGFSVLGTSFIVFTFISSPAFRKPINRLIFYASWGNIVCNIATLMAQSGIRAGRDSHLCQFQAFLIQMFLPADALWNLAMAINVYLTIFRKFTGERLKKLEWIYLFICYGCTFIVALVCLFISSPSRGKVYGANILWCSIDIEWAFLRIALVYGPAWVCIIVSLTIYTLSGIELFKRRAQLMEFKSPRSRSHDLDSISVENLVTDFKTTQIQVVSEPIASPLPDEGFGAAKTIPDIRIASPTPNEIYRPEVVTTIKSIPLQSRPVKVVEMATQGTRLSQQRKRQQRANVENRAALGYTKVALLFFFCMLITWVPASVNRFYSFLHPHQINVPSSYVTSVVLPLMGFWNSVIYMVTSWRAVRNLFTGRLGRLRPWEGRDHHGEVRYESEARTATRNNSVYIGGKLQNNKAFAFENYGSPRRDDLIDD